MHDEITHWLELPAGTAFVKFSELADLIAKALHRKSLESEDCDNLDYEFARLNLDVELSKAVEDKLLHTRDPLTHGPHTFRHGIALQHALVKV